MNFSTKHYLLFGLAIVAAFAVYWKFAPCNCNQQVFVPKLKYPAKPQTIDVQTDKGEV